MSQKDKESTEINADRSCKCNIAKDQVSKAVDTLFEYVSKNREKNPSLLAESERIDLQLGFKKVPQVTNKIIKIPLPTPLHGNTTDVCLFVKDLEKRKRDHAPTVTHYKELLQEAGVTQVNEVIPLKALKLEYQPYEAKKNLSNQYDVFLADGALIRLLPGFLGKSFYGHKKHPIQVNLEATDLKKEITRAMGLTRCIIGGRGPSCQVTVSHTSMSKGKAVANIMAAVDKLAENIPGGAVNIKSLHLRTVDSPSLPIYVSLDSADEVVLPTLKRSIVVDEPDELHTIPHGKVRVTPRGAIQIVNRATRDRQDAEIVSGKRTKRPKKGKRGLPSEKTRNVLGKKGRKVVIKKEDQYVVGQKKSRKLAIKTENGDDGGGGSLRLKKQQQKRKGLQSRNVNNDKIKDEDSEEMFKEEPLDSEVIRSKKAKRHSLDTTKSPKVKDFFSKAKAKSVVKTPKAKKRKLSN